MSGNRRGDVGRRGGGGSEKYPRWLHALGSLKLTLVILAVFAVAIAVATFIETGYNTAAAHILVYNAKWFELLLGLLVVNLIASLILQLPYKLSQIGFVTTHIGFIVVLVAAGMTRFFGYEGRMSIREGASTNEMYSNNDYVHLTVGDETASFPVAMYKNGGTHFKETLDVGGRKYRVAVREYWAHADTRMVEGPGGDPTIVFMTGESAPNESEGLKVGESVRTGGVRVEFAAKEPEITPSSAALGTLIIMSDDGATRFDVPARLPAEVKAGDYTFRIVELIPNFRVGREPEPDDPMENPAIRVEVENTYGEKGERLLFAFHPDFDAGHTGANMATNIPLVYELPRNVYLFRDGDQLAGRADFALRLSSHGGNGQPTDVEIGAGERFVMPAHATLRSGSFAFMVTHFWPSAIEKVVAVDDENARAAIRVSIEDEQSNESEAVVRKWQDPVDVTVGGAEVAVSYHPSRIVLPYSLHLDDFVLKTYPGSSNPASFESLVRIYDEEHGIDGVPARIYMNHPLTYRGFKHFQSSYDRDRKGTILSVNHDPGKKPTYLGYILIGVGFLVTLTRRFWLRQPGGGAGGMSPGLKRGVAAGAFLLALAVGFAVARAQEEGQHEGHHHAPVTFRLPADAPELQRNFLDDGTRDAMRTMMVQDFQGRMKPFDTLSNETITKITKRHGFDGWEPIDMYLAWMLQPQPWFDRPLLAVRNKGLKDMLGVSQSTHHIPVTAILDPSGHYKLTQLVDDTHRKPASERSKAESKLLSFDDRLNVFDLVIRGMSLRLFPVPGDENHRWVAPAELDDELAETIGEDLFHAYGTAWQKLLTGITAQDAVKTGEAIETIRALQIEHGGAVVPSPMAMRAEILLNKYQPFVWVSLPYLLAFFILMGAYARNLMRKVAGPASWKEPLYGLGMGIYLLAMIWHVGAYVARWVASGRAPLSNGYESLLFISVMIAVAGWYYETRGRKGSIAALAALLTSVILGVAMLPGFDPAISPLQPVLASYWLIIHVTVITASYGFLGLAAVAAMAILVMHLFKRPGRQHLHFAMLDLWKLHWNVMITGLAFLSVGTFLGGVWANESWGRYWGWDPKETWSLVTILAFAFVVHMRYVPRLADPVKIAIGSFLSILTVGMTYFGVNYFLAGLHSYASGSAPSVPGWVYGMVVGMIVLSAAAYETDKRFSWFGDGGHKQRAGRAKGAKAAKSAKTKSRRSTRAMQR